MENLLIYYDTEWTEPLEAKGKDQKNKTKRSTGKSRVKVDPRWTLQRVLSDSRYVVPGLPVFYIVPARLESSFLRMDLNSAN